MPFHIREANADEALARLHVQTFNETHRGGHGGGPSYELRARQWREAFAARDGTWFCFVVENDKGEFAGFAKGTGCLLKVPENSRLTDEDETGPEHGVFAKRYGPGATRHPHVAGTKFLQQPELRAAERLRLVRNASKRSVEGRHQESGGFVGHVPQRRDN